MHWLLSSDALVALCADDPLLLFTSLLAALVHDLGHDGCEHAPQGHGHAHGHACTAWGTTTRATMHPLHVHGGTRASGRPVRVHVPCGRARRYNNAFHINSNSALAVRACYASPLERHHLASAYELLAREGSVLSGFELAARKQVRSPAVSRRLPPSPAFSHLPALELAARKQVQTWMRELVLATALHLTCISLVSRLYLGRCRRGCASSCWRPTSPST